MKYTVYQTTNLVNGKIYVGIHTTENPDDSYLGSGELLRAAIQKYGTTSFKKEVLFVFDNPEEMAAKEAEIVTREFVDREDTYNLVPGGHQGDAWYQAWKNIPRETRIEAQKKSRVSYRERLRTDPTFLEKVRALGSQLSALSARMEAEGLLSREAFTFEGRKHADDSRRKMSEAKKGRYDGERNPSFGRVWVCVPGVMERKIPVSELEVYWESGWIRGRKSSKTTAERSENRRRRRKSGVSQSP